MAKRSGPQEEKREPKLAIPLPKGKGIGSLKYWTNEYDQSTKRIEEEIPDWQKNLQRYKGEKYSLPHLSKKDTVQVNLDYSNTEQKKAQLFFQTPEIQVSAKAQPYQAAAPIVQALLNDELNGTIDAKEMVDEILMDLLCPAGICATKIGYESVTVPVEIPTGRIDPLTWQPAVDPKTGLPETATVQKKIYDEYYWRRISPPDIRLPAGFLSTRYEQAPWKGFVFRPDELSLKEWGVDVDGLDTLKPDKTLASERDRKFLDSCPVGVEIWYQASLVDPTEKNPLRLRRLVLLGGKGEMIAVVHENASCQEFGENGAFVRGVKRSPIHVFALRAVSDTAYPPSDCQHARSSTDELSISRSQMVRQRNRARPLRGFDETRVRKKTVEAIENGEEQDLIGFQGDPREQITELATAQFPPDNYTTNEYIQRDVDKSWALGANQQGVREGQVRTATEIATIDKAVDTRLAKERNKFIAWFVKGAEILLSFYQIYADEEKVLATTGPDGLKQFQSWNRNTIAGDFAFKIRPDSSVRLDAAEMAERELRFNNLTANNPNFNQLENARNLAVAFNKNAEKLVAPPQPPPPKPEPPKISVSIKGEDLDPASPQYANVVFVLQSLGGLQNGLAAAEPSDPIKSPRPIPPVDQHDANLTGERSGPAVQ